MGKGRKVTRSHIPKIATSVGRTAHGSQKRREAAVPAEITASSAGMGKAERTDLRIGIKIIAGPAGARVRTPLDHAKRHHRAGKQVGGIATTGCAAKHIHVGCQRLQRVSMEWQMQAHNDAQNESQQWKFNSINLIRRMITAVHNVQFTFIVLMGDF